MRLKILVLFLFLVFLTGCEAIKGNQNYNPTKPYYYTPLGNVE